MTQTLNNGIVVPVPSTMYNPPADMKTMGDTADVVRRVNGQTQMNALTNLRQGTVMCRTDLPGQPLFTYDGTNWISVAPEFTVGQGGNRGYLKGGEALCPTTGFATARVVFQTPFPNMCTGIALTNSTSSVPLVTFQIKERAASFVEFVAFNPSNGAGIINTGLYLNYIATGF